MAKALKIAAIGLAVAGLAITGVGIGAGLSLATATTFGVAGISASALFVASGALSLAAGALQKTPSIPSSQEDRLTATINPRAPRATVYGQTAMATDVRYEEWSGTDQDYCDWIIALASHRIDGVEEIWLNTELAWSASRGVTAKFAGYFSVPNIVLEGSPANAFTFASGKWNGRLTGCAYLRARFKVTGNGKKATSPFSSGVPTRITIIGRGMRLYDPRRDSTVPGGNGPMRADDQSTWRYTADDGAVIGENLALHALADTLGWRIRNPSTGEMKLAVGSGVPARRLNLASWIEAANLADEAVNRSAGGTEPRYHGAVVLSEAMAPKDRLDTICVACNGRFRDTGGKLSFAISHNDLATAALDDGLLDDDVVGPFTWNPDAALDAVPNVVRGKYVDATTASLYQMLDYPDVRLPSLDGQDREFTLDLAAVESPSQAQRIAKQVLQRKQYQREFTAPFDIRAWKYGVGDILPFTFAPLSFERKLFRVKEQEIGQGGVCNMTLTVESPDIYAWDRDDAAPVQPAEANAYDASKNPLILAIDDAATTAHWSAVADDDGKRPDDNATNSGDPGSPFGPGTVAEAIAQLDRIEPITTDVSAIKEQQVGHAAELAALDDARIDLETIQRQAERDAGKLSEATLRLLTESARTREVLRDAGIVVDPVTGVVRIYAVDQVAERTNRVEVGLDAVRGTISLKADSNWVEERIALAVLNPAQAAELEPIIARLTKAEVEVDGLKGTIVSKADAIELTKVGGRVTTAQQDIDALKGSIALKLDKTTFDGLSATVQSLEQKLDTVGDTTSYSLNIRQARLVADDAATAALRGLLAGDDANRRQIVQAAQARQDIFTRLDGDKLTEAQARLALTAEIGAVRSMAVSETTARITAVDAVARDVRALGVTTDKQAAAIGEVNEAVIDAKGGLARNAMTIRQVVGRADTADEAILRALINGDDASRARQAQIVQIQTEFSTTLNANESASAFARQALLARMNAAEAAIVDVQRVLADNIQSLVERVRASEAAWRDPETGLVATRARLALEENLSATRSQANAKAIETLSSTIYDPATGLPAAFSTIGSVRETAANANLATSKAIDQVRAVIDGVGSVGLQQAFEAVVDRLGKIEGTITWQIDVNGNVTGLKLIGGGQGPGSLNLINTDLKMGTGRVVYNTGTYMKVQGVGFGAAKDLIEWYGPTMAISQCSRANALEYRTTTGDAYYGGSLSVGTLRNGNQSSSLAVDAIADMPSFGSNGKPVRYIASWSYYRETTRTYSADNAGLQAFNQDVASYNATSDDGGFTYFGSKNVEQPSSSITLSRSFGQAYEQLQQRSFTTQQQTFAGLKPVVGAGEPGNATFTASIGGGFTVLDPTQSTANRTLRLALSRGFTLPDGVIQRLSIVAIEE